MRPWEQNAANLSASLTYYGPAESRGGVKLITSPVNYSVFNIALMTDPVSDMPGELERRIQVAETHYARTQRQWSFWVCEDYLGSRVARRLIRTFVGHGLSCIAESPGMEAAELPAPRRTLPELDYRRLGDHATRTAFSHIVSHCFNIPLAISQQIYERPDAGHAPLEIWLGYQDTNAVTCAGVIAAAGALGIYSVATLPGWRKRGMAEAVMRHAISDQRARGTGGPLVLQSSAAGMELYRKLGFRRTTRYYVFATA